MFVCMFVFILNNRRIYIADSEYIYHCTYIHVYKLIEM